jgi:formylglycine-generating enzyme required for sulfatase activity
MVHIPAGYARLGNSPTRLRSHFQAIRELAANGALLQQAIEAASREPEQRVFVAEFWIDKYEVTNREYARFLKETKREPPDGWEGTDPRAGKEDHPVENIRHRDAEAYAKWAHKRLPTREQWMRAFRGDEEWLFPWGDTFEPTRANVQENKAFPSASPVTATPSDVSPLGVYNMVGNVCEYLRDKEVVAGQTVVVVKGAHYGALGRIYGIGCMQTLLSGGLTSPGFGFRCVVEKE